MGALGASGVGLLFVLAAPDVALLYPLIFVAGLGLVPALGAMYNLAGKLAPAHGAVEAFGWLSGGTQTGIAGGSALGGLVLQHFGTRTTFAAAAASVFASAAVILLVKGQLVQARMRPRRPVLARGPPLGEADRASWDVASVTTSSPEVRVEPAGEVRGEQVLRYFLTNTTGTEVVILTFGGIIESLRFPDRLGERRDIVLGFKTLEDYVRYNPARTVANHEGAGPNFGR